MLYIDVDTRDGKDTIRFVFNLSRKYEDVEVRALRMVIEAVGTHRLDRVEITEE